MNLLPLGGTQIEFMESAQDALIPALHTAAAMAPVMMVVTAMMMVPVIVIVAIPAAVFAAIPVHGVGMHGLWTARTGAAIRGVLSQNAACKAADRHRQDQLMQSV